MAKKLTIWASVAAMIGAVSVAADAMDVARWTKRLAPLFVLVSTNVDAGESDDKQRLEPDERKPNENDSLENLPSAGVEEVPRVEPRKPSDPENVPDSVPPAEEIEQPPVNKSPRVETGKPIVPKASEVRIWHDKTYSQRRIARYVTTFIKDDQRVVVLRELDGRIWHVKQSDLSDEDVEWLFSVESPNSSSTGAERQSE